MNRSAIRIGLTTTAAAMLTGAVLAHQGVQNPAVLARMDNMTAIADEMEILVGMARRTVEFTPSAADEAYDRLADHASDTIGLFEAPETDPASESRPAIWVDFADFTSLARDMETAIGASAGAIRTREDLVASVRAIGQTCTACHDLYREERP